MRYDFKSAVAGVLCMAITATAAPVSVSAGPMTMVPASVVGPSSSVESARYYRHRVYHRHYRHHYRHYRRYRYGYDPGAAIFAGMLGAMAAGAFGGYPYYDYGYPYYDYGWGGYPGYGGYGGFGGYRHFGGGFHGGFAHGGFHGGGFRGGGFHGGGFHGGFRHR
ncbi:MAG: hypothetical protein WA733_04520 [Methylocystis sp.]